MRFEFTPGALRALAAASGWTSRDDSDELHAPEVLLGLLAEPECRAALVLARHEIDAQRVRGQFPNLAPRTAPPAGREGRFSPAWLACLNAVEELLVEYPRPLELATEHLLLGLAATDNEVSRWLAERGLVAADLEAEVHRLAGHRPGPLPIDLAEIESPGTSRPLGEHEQIAVLRILDAAANRAGEGLRVIEDYLRLALDDRHLTSVCKAIRHELFDALDTFPVSERHAARDTQRDVGTAVTLPSEEVRDGVADVVAASFKRVEQALRSLEEFAKTQSPEAAAALEQLRYRVYTLERAADITRSNLDRLADARLYVLVDGGASEAAFGELISTLVEGGASIIQLRDKRLADRELLARARLLRKLTRGTATLAIVNDRPDLAVLSEADGVHVGQDELSVKDARRIVGPRALVGVSTHSLVQARAAVLDGADYIGVGPTFPSETKQFADFTGPQLLAAVAAEIRLPAFAIGGITQETLPQVLAAGFSRIAVSAAVVASVDPGAAAKRLLAVLGG
jgi:thiamine-phosphate pyrophosphorylase